MRRNFCRPAAGGTTEVRPCEPQTLQALALAEVGLAHAAIAGQLCSRAAERDAARLQNIAPIGELEGGAGVLLHQHHGDPPGGKRRNHLKTPGHNQRRQPEGRLVEQQQLGPADQRPCQGQHLLFTPGEGSPHLRHSVAQHRKQAAGFVDVALQLRPIGLREAAELQIFPHR